MFSYCIITVFESKDGHLGIYSDRVLVDKCLQDEISGLECSLMAELLPTICKVLGLIHSTTHTYTRMKHLFQIFLKAP
jgi:hypothetical protein